MRVIASLAVVFVLATHAGQAMAQDFPDRLIALLKPNEYVGMSSTKQQIGDYHITILTRNEFELARDLEALDIGQVAAKHTDIAKQYAQLKSDGEKEIAKSL